MLRCNISQIAAAFCPFDRAVFEFAVELLRRHLQFMDQIRIRNIVARGECRVAIRRSEAIPRADYLADITSKDPITDGGAQLGRKFLLSSIVRYEMQRRASIVRSGRIHCVGQASRHRLQVPHGSVWKGASGSSSMPSRISAMRKYEP